MQCGVCESPAKFACKDCKNKHYCSELHQRADWHYNHSFVCGIGPRSPTRPSLPGTEQKDTSTAILKWDTDETNHLCLPLPIKELWIQTLLGEGGYGRVYAACADEQCTKTVVVKFQALNNANKRADFESECAMASLMDYAGVAPKLFFHDVLSQRDAEKLTGYQFPFGANSIGIMVMERCDYDLGHAPARLFNQVDNVRLVIDQLSEKVKIMHQFLVHCDLFEKNVLIKVKGAKVVGAYISDFGISLWNYRRDDIGYAGESTIQYWLNSAAASSTRVDRVLNATELNLLNAFDNRQPNRAGFLQAYQRQLQVNPYRVDDYLLAAFKAKYT